ncbi:hypothetical protein BJX76DRAFT_369010 [Aspergillus varians]
MKVKCSGSEPCTRCTLRKEPCRFPTGDMRVSVSERYLRYLEEQLSKGSRAVGHADGSQMHHLGGPPNVDGRETDLPTPNTLSSLRLGPHCQPPESSPAGRVQLREDTNVQQGGHTTRFSQNPLVDRDPSFAKTPDGRFGYMGPSSTWSFYRRVVKLIGRRVSEPNCPPDPWHSDGMAFTLQWKPVYSDEVIDISNLLPLDYSLFLFNATKFYFGFLSFLIDEELYLRNLHDFYRDPAATANSSRYWYAQYLLVLAFGKAFLAQKSPSGSPPGHQYASRAMALLLDLSGMHEDPLMCIQALSLGAVYLQSIDMRRAAFQHIGQALRGCIIEGIHRHVPEELGGVEYSSRCRTIFWMVYMLDQEFSALIGAPSSIRDEDITVMLPDKVESSVENVYLTLHVRLSRLMTRILTTVYGVGEEFNGTLVQNTQAILHSMAELSHDLTEFLNTHFYGVINRASKMAIRLMISHHHCVVLTTRPLVMCVLNMHIERTERQTPQAVALPPPVASILRRCVDSAQTILQTLQTLADDDLIDGFLPFQIEDAFSSAFVLYLIRTIAPYLINSSMWCDNLDCVLDKLIATGNVTAPLRRQELRQLEQILAPLALNPNHSPLPPIELYENAEFNEQTDGSEQVDVDVPFQWELLGLDSSVSLLPGELLDLANRLDVENIIQSAGAAV